MAENYDKIGGPMVSVLVPTFNRPAYLALALASVLRQSYRNLQLIVINDGGVDVSDIIKSFDDHRLIFINRKENRGKAFSLNEALTIAQGKYIAYLDDDDLYYPNHIETLVNVLENQTDCQVAYSDLYKVYCRVLRDGSRQVLSKVIEISRDFDRFFMLYFNHALHVSVMHRRDLIEKTGPYNEKLNILIDWDITRRLAFFSDFYHVCEITGEFYSPVGDCDRISVQRRKDKSEYLRNVLMIRTSRPPKPWSKIKDLSIIFACDQLNRQAGKTIGAVWQHTFYPYELYLPMLGGDFDKLNTPMPNIIKVAVGSTASATQKIDAALNRCSGEYVVVLPSGFPIKDEWVELSLYALINNSTKREGFELADSTDALWAAVVRRDDMLYARRNFPNLSMRESLMAAGIEIRRPKFEEMPFQFDNLLKEAQSAEKDGNWMQATRMFECIADRYQNQIWMKTLAAKAFFKAGGHRIAAKLSSEVNRQRPTVDTLLLEARADMEDRKFDSAIESLKKAQDILEGSRIVWT